MRIVYGRRAMRGPARVRDTGRSGRRIAGQLGGQVPEFALGAAALELAVMDGADAGRIIAAIFQPLEPVDQPVGHVAAPQDSDNAAHGK